MRTNSMLTHIFLSFALVISGLSFYVPPSYGSELYFLCGPDEDGCFEDDYRYCACIPQDNDPNAPHCLDFSKLQCVPASEEPLCPQYLIFKDQGSCIATIFHSIPTKPCHVQTRAFCITNRIQFCDHNGEPKNCHSSPN